ncbi:cbb3-type cytochrome c oxidase subunit 3 [Halobacteriovorax sp. GB3]|uniref:cbb3-type cytochrome oxidase subunit 3 n=1 Tax=Halobacteriovorax sp. GB3 TaxID=2719615 RepID=UPI00235ECD8B|nr:cbb3-type cytochrome c oxidase subunit 3 [Halobacteriovorax sp. GB3]MDD0853398.1 cbb3-type cytochrome c oxidase subunit 3 [Halobacteriovorax sp. GB3]
MFKEVMANINSHWYPTLGLFLFFSIFIGATLWTMRKESHKIYDEASNLPLEDGTTLSSMNSKGAK